MANKDLVWYAAYGSNMLEERFLHYINGGIPRGSERNYEPCSDLAPPKDIRPYEINFELFFARESSSWKGGIAFIEPEKSNESKTLAKLYLISKTQFNHLAKGETQAQGIVEIDFDQAVNEGRKVFKRPSWYGLVLFLGYFEDLPVFTLTGEKPIDVFTRPNENYLSIIASGLRQTHGLNNQEIFQYFSSKEGILGNYKSYELYDLVYERTNKEIEFVRALFDQYAKDFNSMPDGDLKEKKKKELENLMKRYYGEIHIDNLGESFNI
ncbi:hypothetical protein [Flavobacterium sp.]|uniref:hypothetical protein n=1 Tax=Flavobacterium sp. TaxID=239 RepID=UPI0031D1BB81